MLTTPSPPRPHAHGHVVAARAAGARRPLALAFAAGAALATLTLLAAGRRGGDGGGSAAWTAAAGATGPPPRANALALAALAGDGAAVEAPAPGAPPHPAAAAIVPLRSAAGAAAAAATALSAAAAAAGGSADVEIIVVAASQDAAAALLGTAADSMPGLRLIVRASFGGGAALRNDGVRAARAPIYAVLSPGVRLLPGYWDAVVRAAGDPGGRDRDFFFTGPPPPGTKLNPSRDEWREGAPWANPTPPATAVRRAAWARVGGYPAGGPPGGDADALFLGVVAERGGVHAVQATDAPLYDSGGVVAPSDAEVLDIALGVAAAGAPLDPPTVVRSHELLLDAARADSGALQTLFETASKLAAAPGLACPASAPADLIAGLAREAAWRLDDAAAAYGRAARCAARTGVPALAWAARMRADVVRVAALRRCVAKAAAAQEPGDAPRPTEEGAKADAGECVRLLLGDVV